MPIKTLLLYKVSTNQKMNKFSEILKDSWLWNEYKYICQKMKFSLYGSSSIGIPDFYKESLKNMAEKANPNEFQYNTSNTELVNAISDYFPTSSFFERKIKQEEIAVTPGALKAIHTILCNFLDLQNDEVVLFQPFFTNITTDLTFRNFYNFKFVNRKSDFSIDFEDLENKLSEKTKFLLLINPDNPTMHMLTEPELEKLTVLLNKYPRILVIEDIAYFSYMHIGHNLKSFSDLGLNKDKTFSIFSGGKLFHITGIRCGWAIGPRHLMQSIRDAVELCFLYVSPTDSLVMAENLKNALKKYKDFDSYYDWALKDQNDRYYYIRDFIQKNFKEIKVKESSNHACYYIIIDISNYLDKIPDKYFYTLDEKQVYKKNLDMAFCRMLAEEGIGTLPLSSVSLNDDYDHLIRISVNKSYEELDVFRDGLNRLREKNLI